jgi:hypothetical protein
LHLSFAFEFVVVADAVAAVEFEHYNVAAFVAFPFDFECYYIHRVHHHHREKEMRIDLMVS